MKYVIIILMTACNSNCNDDARLLTRDIFGFECNHPQHKIHSEVTQHGVLVICKCERKP